MNKAKTIYVITSKKWKEMQLEKIRVAEEKKLQKEKRKKSVLLKGN